MILKIKAIIVSLHFSSLPPWRQVDGLDNLQGAILDHLKGNKKLALGDIFKIGSPAMSHSCNLISVFSSQFNTFNAKSTPILQQC